MQQQFMAIRFKQVATLGLTAGSLISDLRLILPISIPLLCSLSVRYAFPYQFLFSTDVAIPSLLTERLKYILSHGSTLCHRSKRGREQEALTLFPFLRRVLLSGAASFLQRVERASVRFCLAI